MATLHYPPKPMRSLALRWLVLLFTCAWFGVLVPIHNRGAIQLPGASGPTCCMTETEATDAKPACHAKKGDDGTPAKPASNCAVCYFVATLDLPAPVMLTVPPLGPAKAIARFDVPPPADIDHVRTRCERGPPAV